MFNCSNCGYKSIGWLGKCPLCGEWETFSRQEPVSGKSRRGVPRKNSSPTLIKDITGEQVKRISTGMAEFDRIIGGGLVKGEVILVGGEPGVGKSTLLLEVSSKLAKNGKTLYVSAEESTEQVSLRASRLRGDFDSLYILGEDNLELVYKHIKEEGFKFIIIDSIQVVYYPQSEGSKGSVSQIRGCADYLTQIAKSLGVVIFMVGHVTKDGAIAGPKLLEHIVDCVLYFEGETISNYRILRAIKNRFGSTGDIAVFEMKCSGLEEVTKLAEIFLPHRQKSFSGSCVTCVIEGLRPLLIELQSLAARSNFGVARRRSLGFDFNRFSLLVAIIEKRLKLPLSGEDVFLNVAGGLKINDPAADLGTVMAIISSFRDKDIPPSIVFIGEVGLAGELRRVSNINMRLKEVKRADFKQCIIPEVNLKEVDKKNNLDIKGFSSLKEVVDEVFK
ncbi:MAG: DNA repair protein RadA [Candidatus Omnitrophica bacterium]|nr:DNA repair protein RadA [Candidatus Omnitrophota bacterium]MDD5430218.1 DNA repair protein RadA [Candidatus Omnitrophota bacterium]